MGGERSSRFRMARSTKRSFPLRWDLAERIGAFRGSHHQAAVQRSRPRHALDTRAIPQGHGALHVEVVGRYATRRSVMRVSSARRPSRSAKPRDAADAHRPWTDTPDGLEDRLARREERTLSKALTFRANGTVYCVRTKGPGTALRGVKVELRHRLGGDMTGHYKDRILPVTACRTYPMPDPAEDEKTIDLRLDAIVSAQRCTAPAMLGRV